MKIELLSLNCVLQIALAGCSANTTAQQIAPFADQPHQVFDFRYTDINVTGTVWGFLDDGTPLTFGGPVGLKYEDEATSGVAISGTEISLLTTSDAANQSPKRIMDLLDAAGMFCATRGYIQIDRDGAGFYSCDGVLYLLGICKRPK